MTRRWLWALCVLPVLSAQAQELAAPEATNSLFFTADDMQKIHEAEEAFRTKAALPPEIAPVVVEAPKVVVQTNYPQFYLNSIAYHTPSDWTVWANGVKYTQASAPDEITVVAIDADSVELLWKPANTQGFADRWDLPPGKGVTLDKDAHTMRLHLRPNQTFSSKRLRVEEGKLAAEVIPPETPPGMPGAASPSVPPGNPAMAVPTAKTPGAPKEGLDGLLNAYKRTESTPHP